MADLANQRNVVVALQKARLLNADLTLREIVSAAQKIPGLGDTVNAMWTFITRDFIYKGCCSEQVKLDFAQISALEESKVIRFDITLGEILRMSEDIPGLSESQKAGWEFISPDFVFRGGMITDRISVNPQ